MLEQIRGWFGQDDGQKATIVETTEHDRFIKREWERFVVDVGFTSGSSVTVEYDTTGEGVSTISFYQYQPSDELHAMKSSDEGIVPKFGDSIAVLIVEVENLEYIKPTDAKEMEYVVDAKYETKKLSDGNRTINPIEREHVYLGEQKDD